MLHSYFLYPNSSIIQSYNYTMNKLDITSFVEAKVITSVQVPHLLLLYNTVVKFSLLFYLLYYYYR